MMDSGRLPANQVLQALLTEAAGLPPVGASDAAAYACHASELAAHVDGQIECDAALVRMMAPIPLEVSRLNHRNHVQFMTAVFELHAWEVMIRTVVWVYRSYVARGMPTAYFPAELDAFRDGLRRILPSSAAALDPAYALLRGRHDAFVQLSNEPAEAPESLLSPARDRFLRALLEADTEEAIRVASTQVIDRSGVAAFYEQTVAPAMAEVGALWESGRISVAQEHVATAVANRAIASLYEAFVLTRPHRGRALVACATGELHEMGARMVADLLEMEGWEVRYAGADVPVDALSSLLDAGTAVVAISASMFFHVPRVREMVAVVRAGASPEDRLLLVGGRVFVDFPELAERVGADAAAVTAADAVRMANQWWGARHA